MSGILGGITQTAQSISQTTNDVTGLATQTVGLARTIDNSGNSWAGGQWWQQLQPGSWRGVGFVLDAGELRAGRRVAIHEYPYRDDVWPEDLGKLPRRFAVQCYLVGDDVYQQRDAMVRACEQPGAGTLVHPTLGSIQCVLLEFAVADRRERGRYVECMLTFIQAGDLRFPISAIATGDLIKNCSMVLNDAAKSDFSSALSSISSVSGAAIASVSQYTNAAQSVVNDASRIMGCVRGLPIVGAYFGRYANGAMRVLQAPLSTVSRAISTATTTRTAVYQAGIDLNHAANLL